jgi:hypothetical protein
LITAKTYRIDGLGKKDFDIPVRVLTAGFQILIAVESIGSDYYEFMYRA